jgi:EAL domain-containing protein (putative c-di-GMP-specific phosphodiesterase class I)
MGILYLGVPMEVTAGSIRSFCKALTLDLRQLEEQLFKIECSLQELKDFCKKCDEDLSSLEMYDTRALFLECNEEFLPSSILKMRSLQSLSSQLEGEWLISLLSQNRLDTHFQPVVHADNPHQIFGYECLSRGIDESGGIISPARMFDAARKGDLLFQLDRAARMAAISNAHKKEVSGNLLINFLPTTIYQPEFCLRSTLEALEKSNYTSDRIIFEVVESEFIHDVPHLKNILSFYRERGYKVALDDLGAGYNSLMLMGELRPDLVKLDASLIKDADRDPFKGAIIKNICTLSKDFGITVLAEGVETGSEYHFLKDIGIDLIQGYYFGKPQADPVTEIKAG